MSFKDIESWRYLTSQTPKPPLVEDFLVEALWYSEKEYILNHMFEKRSFEETFHIKECLIQTLSVCEKELQEYPKIRNIIRDCLRQVYWKLSAGTISIGMLWDIVTNYFDSELEYINELTRKREIVTQRQIAMFFACFVTWDSLRVIGEYFWWKDHTTVIHARKTILKLCESHNDVRSAVVGIWKRIRVEYALENKKFKKMMMEIWDMEEKKNWKKSNWWTIKWNSTNS
jgi:hypothetical protein